MSEQLTAVVVDDESLARDGLVMRLDKTGDVKVLATCSNGREAVRAVGEHRPDMVFLDIQMPGMSGLEVIKQLQQDEMPLIVFVTAYDAFAVDAFNVHAVDYLLKPIEDERLEESIRRARERRSAPEGGDEEKQRLLDIVMELTGKSATAVKALLDDGEGATGGHVDRLAIRDGSATLFVPVRDIDWIDAAGDYMCVHVKGETHIMRTTMKELESQLDPNMFQRVHRSTIVNLHRVERISSHINGEYHLTLVCGTSLKMSRSYKDKVRHFFDRSAGRI
ncbi:MAG: LytR/AlgR family response regulator transcription factor [Pseudomonadota bacterium]